MHSPRAVVGETLIFFSLCFLYLRYVDSYLIFSCVFKDAFSIQRLQTVSIRAGWKLISPGCALIRDLRTTAATRMTGVRTGHYKLTATRDKPLTYEQANPPYRIGVTKSWNSWNSSNFHVFMDAHVYYNLSPLLYTHTHTCRYAATTRQKRPNDRGHRGPVYPFLHRRHLEQDLAVRDRDKEGPQ